MNTFAIIGTGPRGLSILERLAIELKQESPVKNQVEVYIFDNVEPGAGRIWKTDQQDCFLMNTLSRDVTMYSEPIDDKPQIFKHRPTLAEWIEESDDYFVKAHRNKDFVPRKIYGLYLKCFFIAVIKQLSKVAEITVIHDEVIDISFENGDYILETLRNGEQYKVSSIVLALGHGKDNRSKSMLPAHIRSGVRYVEGDSAADMNLHEIPTSKNVFIKGLGLGFYHIISSLYCGLMNLYT